MNHHNPLVISESKTKRATFHILVLCIVFLGSTCFLPSKAQNIEGKPSSPSGQKQDVVLKNTHVKALENLSEEFKEKYEENYRLAVQKAKKENWFIQKKLSDGRLVVLAGLDDLGNPLYLSHDNLESAQTTSTDKLWAGGGMGLSLDGAGMTSTTNGLQYARLGMWEVGKGRLTHQEFNGRVIQRDNPSSEDFSNHAAHVAGTLVAQGINSNARGMAFAARLDAYDSSGDASEMAFAASRGMLISNHSYGTVTGWAFGSYSGGDDSWHWFGDTNLSELEDYRFGLYDSRSRDWDRIAYQAPYYLIVKSAGNDRNDNVSGITHKVRINGTWTESSTPREPDGGTDGYDCISTYSGAKNILSVAAVNRVSGGYNPENPSSQVVMSNFSGWGPTDDGRIKPDISAQGVNVFSALSTGDDQYNNLSGTSMAAPNVAGSLLLLQQHYQNIKGEGFFMRAATLKGLVIHTADEAGNAPGPDYQFGWGLLNAAKAADFISDEYERTIIQEQTLQNDVVRTLTLSPTGTEPLVVTICWTDPQSETAPALLNAPTPKLIHDLDIRLESNTGDVFLPYVLDPANPNAPATQGDNILDNVEKIFLDNPTAASYTLTVRHKGTLNTAQDYSLLVSGANAQYNDISVLSIESEVSSCELSSASPIKVTLRNLGTTSQGNIQGSYSIFDADTNELIESNPVTFAGVVSAGQSRSFTFNIDLSISGKPYLVKFQTNLSGDQVSENNESEANFLNTRPDTPSSNIVLTNPFPETMRIELNAGNGEQRLILVKENTPFTSADLPTQNTSISASNTFGLGQRLGSAYVVYRGSSNAVTVFGLVPDVTYYVAAIEYSCSPPTYFYDEYPTASTLITNLNENSLISSKIAVYPNPTTQQIRVDLGGYVGQENQVSLYNSLGNLVLQPVSTSEPQVSLEVATLPKGVYFLKIQNASGVVEKRIVIH